MNNCVLGRQPVTVSGDLWGGEGRTQVHIFGALESKGNIVHRDGVQQKCPRTQTALRIGVGSTRPLATGQLLRSERREGILGTSGPSSVEPGAAPAHGGRLPSGGTRRHARCFTSDQETRAQQKVTERRPYFLAMKVLGWVGRVTCSLAPQGGSFGPAGFSELVLAPDKDSPAPSFERRHSHRPTANPHRSTEC